MLYINLANLVDGKMIWECGMHEENRNIYTRLWSERDHLKAIEVDRSTILTVIFFI
jgi:hypothetical protein